MACPYIYFIGPPNVGKTTVADFLTNKYMSDYVRLSPGDLLRSHAKTDSVLGEYVRNNWNHNSLTPLVNEFMVAEFSKSKRFVVDGFPRSQDELMFLPHLCNNRPFIVIELTCNLEQLQQRSMERNRGQDDNDTSFGIRMKSYNDNIAPIRTVLKRWNVYYCILTEDINRIKEVCESIYSIIIDHKQQVPTALIPNPMIKVRGKYTESASAVYEAIIIQTVLQLAESTRKYKLFCGTHPISLTRDKFEQIQSHSYLLSLKLDGERYMCCIFENTIWFLSRSCKVSRGPTSKELYPFNNTLIDGEMLKDGLFVVLDVLNVAGHNVMHDPIVDRFKAMSKLFAPLNRTTIKFRAQEYYGLVDNLARIINDLAHGRLDMAYDGICFTPARLPYRLGIDKNMFKWKDLRQNTVDFMYRNGQLYIQQLKPYEMIPVANYVSDPRTYQQAQDGDVVECYWDMLNNTWKFSKIRRDKSGPNVDWVAQRIIQSIKDNIQYRDLLTLLQRLPPPSKQEDAMMSEYRESQMPYPSPTPPPNTTEWTEYLRTPVQN